jgi:hypothetical protein
MENRKKLHDYGLALIFIGILNLFTFFFTIVAGFVDGTVNEMLATVEADILVAVKVGLAVVGTFLGLLVFADVLIGWKALKVSKTPNADKGYIIAAKVFFVLSVISAGSTAFTLFDGSAPIMDAVLSFCNAALSVIVYVYFIHAAQAVRQDVLNAAK